MLESYQPTAVATGVNVQPAEFPTFSNGPRHEAIGGGIQNFIDVAVPISAELGRVTLPLAELMKLGPGSILELDSQVSDPVDLLAQGVRFARGEVVVVNDLYAVRILEVLNTGLERRRRIERDKSADDRVG